MDQKQPVLTGALKKAGNYRKGGNTGFDTSMNRLQAQCYILISDFKYMTDKHGKTYGWGVAEYETPERFFGEAFTERVYEHEPEESFRLVLAHLQELHPQEDAARLVHFLAGGNSDMGRGDGRGKMS